MPKLFSLADISTKTNSLPDRIFFYALEGWGKTTLAAYSPDPLFIQCKGETGLDTLKDAALVPEDVPSFPPCETWEQFQSALAQVLGIPSGKCQYGTLVIDTGNSAEDLCSEFVCNRDFGGDWSERGFGSFGKGFEVTEREWNNMLATLDKIRSKHKMRIIMLAHQQVKTFQNPQGSDYDRISPSLHKRVWATTHKWADMILYGAYDDRIKEGKTDSKGNQSKGKVIQATGQKRIIHTTRSVLFDAKNRHGLPSTIKMSNDHTQAWADLEEAIAEAIEANRSGEKAEKKASPFG